MTNDLALLLATNPVTYSRHVRSVLVMQAEVEMAKAHISLATVQYQWALRAAHTDAKRLSQDRTLHTNYLLSG